MLYNLLGQWQRYIYLVKMDNKRVEVMKGLEEEIHSQYDTASKLEQKANGDLQDDYSWDLDTSKVNLQDQEGELSANEKMTSEEEEEVDVEQVIKARQNKQAQIDNKIDTYTKLTQQQKDSIFNEYKTKEKTDFKID